MDDGQWGFPYEENPLKPNETYVTQRHHGFAGDRGEGAMFRVVVLAPTDAIYEDLRRHGMVR
jgi:hypothetical protein